MKSRLGSAANLVFDALPPRPDAEDEVELDLDLVGRLVRHLGMGGAHDQCVLIFPFNVSTEATQKSEELVDRASFDRDTKGHPLPHELNLPTVGDLKHRPKGESIPHEQVVVSLQHSGAALSQCGFR